MSKKSQGPAHLGVLVSAVTSALDRRAIACVGAGAATAPVGRAEGHAVGWHTARAAPQVRAPRRAIARGVQDTWMARTRQRGRRVRNGPRRACAGWAVKRQFGHST